MYQRFVSLFKGESNVFVSRWKKILFYQTTQIYIWKKKISRPLSSFCSYLCNFPFFAVITYLRQVAMSFTRVYQHYYYEYTSSAILPLIVFPFYVLLMHCTAADDVAIGYVRDWLTQTHINISSSYFCSNAFLSLLFLN